MSRHDRVPLESFCRFSGGGKLKLCKADYVPNGYAAFSAAGQDGFTSRWEFDCPGVVVSSIGARCGKAFLAAGRWTTLANTYAVLPDPEKADARFLWYQLNDEASWHRSGTGQPFIKPTDIKKRLVYLPELSEQRHVVDLLSRAENIVRMRREAEQKAKEIIPALFLDMFGDPATNPKGWATATLGDILRSADYGSSSKAFDSGHGIPLIRMGNVNYDGWLDLSDLKYVELDRDEVARYELERGDLLFNRTNSKELVGKTGLWETDLPAVAASYFIRLRVDEARVRPFFVWAFMNTAHMKKTLFATARGAIGQANINSRELRAFRIRVPDLTGQGLFEERCRQLLVVRTQHANALAVSISMFQGLLGSAFADPCHH